MHLWAGGKKHSVPPATGVAFLKNHIEVQSLCVYEISCSLLLEKNECIAVKV